MKVLYVTTTLSAGGAELQLSVLARELKRQGFAVVVACLYEQVPGSRSLRPEFEAAGIPVIDLRARDRHDWRALVRLFHVIRTERPDILHTHLVRADLVGSLAAVFASGPALVCSVHGIYRQRWFGPYAGPLMNWAYRRAGAVIPISSAVADWLRSDFHVPEEKLHTIYYGVEADKFGPSMSSPTGPESRPMVIGSAGRFTRSKGFQYLIEAMRIVAPAFPEARAIVAGYDAGYGRVLKALIERARLEDRVQLVGFQDDIASFLRGLRIFAFPSLTEGLGQAVLEAMAAGLPVVTFDIKPLSELVVPEETGILVKPADSVALANALKRLLCQPELVQRMGGQGKRRVREHFNVPRMVDQMLSVYASLHP